MEAKPLIADGMHWLSGIQEFRIDENDERNDTWSDLDGYAIIIDGNVYLAVEDHDDGYRSYAYLAGGNKYGVEINNQFEPQLVYAETGTERMEDEDGWPLKDASYFRFKNQYGQTVLEVSTDYSDGYYPCGRVSYHPENLPCNAKPLPN